MDMKADITADQLRTILDYSSDTGEFRWRARPVGMFTASASRSAEHVCKIWNAKNAGKLAGTENGKGYRRIRVLGRLYLSHRLAWLHAYGEWPIGEIDHANLDASDTRLSNLRVATRSQNMANKARGCANKSGFKGVHWSNRDKKWRAMITVAGKKIFVGLFSAPDEAGAAYAAAAKSHFAEFARL